MTSASVYAHKPFSFYFLLISSLPTVNWC